MPLLHHRRWWLALGWLLVAVVLTLCLIPAPPQPPLVTSDKAHHLLAFAALGLWWRWLAVRWWTPHLALLGFAVLIEVLQGTCTATRQAEAADVLADALGLVLGEALFRTPLYRLLPWLDARLTRHGP